MGCSRRAVSLRGRLGPEGLPWSPSLALEPADGHATTRAPRRCEHTAAGPPNAVKHSGASGTRNIRQWFKARAGKPPLSTKAHGTPPGQARGTAGDEKEQGQGPTGRRTGPRGLRRTVLFALLLHTFPYLAEPGRRARSLPPLGDTWETDVWQPHPGSSPNGHTWATQHTAPPALGVPPRDTARTLRRKTYPQVSTAAPLSHQKGTAHVPSTDDRRTRGACPGE